jgi:hypothetical protein
MLVRVERLVNLGLLLSGGRCFVAAIVARATARGDVPGIPRAHAERNST